VARLYEAQWLRWADPFGDHPPYSRVVYHVEPGGVRVPYGSVVDIRVRVEDGTVDKLDLLLLTDGATVPEKMSMFPEGPGQWRATLTSVLSPGVYWVRSLAGRTRKFSIDVITVPELQEVRFRVEPPAYTNLPAYEGPLPQGGLTGLPGTKVRMWAKSNRPLARGRLVFADDKAEVSLAPAAAGAAEAIGEFALRRPGKALLHVFDADGQRSLPDFAVPIQIATDEPPRLRIVEPPPFSVATPAAIIPVMMAAEDDYGIAKLFLFRSLNDSRPLGTREKLPAVPPTRITTVSQLSLAAFGLSPGDEIKIHGRAEDSDPSGPNVAETPAVVIKIISQAEFDRMVASRQTLEMLLTKYRQAQRRLEAAKNEMDRLRKKVKSSPSDADDSKDVASLAEQMLKDAAELAKWLDKNQNELDEALRKHLEKTSRELMRLSERAQKAAQSKLSPRWSSSPR
jgi:transcription termination factor NusB